MTIPVDMDGNKLTLGTRVATADNVYGIIIKVGRVVGYTEKRIKVDFGDLKPQSKIASRLVKTYIQLG